MLSSRPIARVLAVAISCGVPLVLVAALAKFIMLWTLQRRESREMRSAAGVPTFGDA